jgi:hypothetical protein
MQRAFAHPQPTSTLLTIFRTPTGHRSQLTPCQPATPELGRKELSHTHSPPAHYSFQPQSARNGSKDDHPESQFRQSHLLHTTCFQNTTQATNPPNLLHEPQRGYTTQQQTFPCYHPLTNPGSVGQHKRPANHSRTRRTRQRSGTGVE